MSADPIRLTQLSAAAGCGCKTDPTRLARILDGVTLPTHAGVLVDSATHDDGGVVRLSDDLAIIVTADFFTPIVDDAYDFGRIAAANALSDVYAMGGTPTCALNLVGYPSRTLPMGLLTEILRGGAAVCAAEGVAIVGGHTIDDPEPKYGLAVVGTVHPAAVLTNAGARAGDALVLTKPLGTGILSTALKAGVAAPEAVAAMTAVMATTNRAAAEAMRTVEVHAVTDVTGFGLLGHLREMCAGSGTGATVWADAVPLLDGVRGHVAEDIIPAGTYANMRALEGAVEWIGRMDGDAEVLLADAQTSGGLLVALAPASADAFIGACHARGLTATAVIGRCESIPGMRVRAARPGTEEA